MIYRLQRYLHDRNHNWRSGHDTCPICLQMRLDSAELLADIRDQRVKELTARINFLNLPHSRLLTRPQPTPPAPPRKDPPTMAPNTSAFTGEGEWYWHIHHAVLLEKASEPIQNRVDYILKHKSRDEIATRLRVMHRAYVPDALQDIIEALGDNEDALFNPIVKAEVERLHKEQCFADCPWDGETLFP